MQSQVYSHTVKGQDVYISPPQDKHKETVIFLHGLGDTATGGWMSFFKGKDPSPCFETTKVVMLTAPTAAVTIAMGMKIPSWYDIKSLIPDPSKFAESVCLKEVEKSTERVRAVLKEEIELLGDSKKVILAGFSQGCALALHAGLGYEKQLGGIIGWSGFIFPTTEAHTENQNTPLFIANGTDDMTVPFMLADFSYKKLDGSKHSVVRLKEKGCGHIINENIAKETKKWLEKLIGK